LAQRRIFALPFKSALPAAVAPNRALADVHFVRFISLVAVMAVTTSMSAQNSDTLQVRRVITLSKTENVSNLLGGRVAGVVTMPTSDKPGKNLSEFWVRGIGTFGTGASALVLIDGVEGDLNSLSPEDIQSFTILKGASAIAVYGTRGTDGVVLINTKSGRNNLIEPETNSTISEKEEQIEPETIATIVETENQFAPDLDTTQLEHDYASEVEAETVETETENPFPNLKIYPNPFFGTLNLTGAEGCTLIVIAEDGVIVHTQKLNNPLETIVLEHLRSGVYFFCVNDGKHTKTVRGVKN